MTSLCEVCGPENECTCGGCQCKWCRHRRGDYLSPIERRQIEAHIAALAANARRAALRKMLADIKPIAGREH